MNLFVVFRLCLITICRETVSGHQSSGRQTNWAKVNWATHQLNDNQLVVDFGANRKRVHYFLLVINSNLGPILLRFRDRDVHETFQAETETRPRPRRSSSRDLGRDVW